MEDNVITVKVIHTKSKRPITSTVKKELWIKHKHDKATFRRY